MSVTELSKDYVNKIVDDLLRKYDLAFDGEFEAFTPWWGGNEFGYVFYPEPHYPEPKAIIGRVKWAIRTMLGEVPKELGSLENASVVKVLVSVTKPGEGYFDSVPTLSGSDRRGALEGMREAGYSLVFQGYQPRSSLANKFLGFKKSYGLYRLLTIPRFYLRALGRSGQRLEEALQNLRAAQPMKPGFRIRVTVLSKDKRIARLFVTAMLITMKYLGIGGAANRGFGRFRLTRVDYVVDGVNTNIDITRDDVYTELRNMGFEPRIDPGKGDPQFPRFPLPNEVRVVKGPVSALLVVPDDNEKFTVRKYRARDIEGVLAAIGIATLKSTWKSYWEVNCKGSLGGENYRLGKQSKHPGSGPGREYHTWVLGLPRSAKKRRDGESKRHQEEGREKKDAKKDETGYFIVYEEEHNEEKEDKGRRQSYIVISPTEDLGALLIPFYANDYPYRGIRHKDHREDYVTQINRVTPNCKSLGPSSSVRDHVDLAMEWLETLLG